MKYLPFFLIGIVSGLVGLGGGYYLWGRVKPTDPLIESKKIDSLRNEVLILQDSISSIDAELKVVHKDRIRYKTLYDTIVQFKETKDIVNSLNQIIKTPPQ